MVKLNDILFNEMNIITTKMGDFIIATEQLRVRIDFELKIQK
jgi:hypothetical protein